MKRIVVKFGTGILTMPGGVMPDLGQYKRLSDELAEIMLSGVQCILVSSGAVTAGLAPLGLDERPSDLPGKQAAAAAGQPILIRNFDSCLTAHGLGTAQLLLTHGDIDSRCRRHNARNTLERLLAARTVLPIINENDSVAVEEINFGDNDRLSAEVALLAEADLLIILTSSDGVLANGQRVPLIQKISDAQALVLPEKGRNSVGGMAAKLAAVEIAVRGGVETVVADGRKPGQLALALAGGDAGTRFPKSQSHAKISTQSTP